MMFLALVVAFAVCFAAVKGADVEALLNSMSLEAKIGQMVQIDISVFMISGTSSVNYTAMENYIKEYQIGSILNSPFSGGPINGVTGYTAQEWRELNQKILQYSRETTSQVPIIYGIDSIHGATFVKDAALMPQALNLAATFNETNSYQAGYVTAKDTRAAGIPWIFAPVLGLGLQPLWARYPETFGEDPYLAGVMGASIIQGLQYIANDGSLPKMTAACMKHFIAYSIPVDGHDRSPVQLPDRILKQLYIPSFQAAVDAGVLTAMESYQEVGGVPMVSSNDYLTTLIRKQMNFTGFMVTDYQEIENLHNWHLVSATQRDAVELVMQDTTVDMSMVPLDTSFYNYLLDLVNSGEVNVSRVDDSVRRILNVKNTLGLLDANYNIDTNDALITTVGQSSDWDISLNAARESITLVQNDGTLPLSSAAYPNILVTGPTCNSSISQSGGWSLHWQGIYYEWEPSKKVTVYDGVSSLYDGTLQYFPGPPLNATSVDNVTMTTAKAMANNADAIIICLGEGTYAEKPGDIDDLALPQGQIDYVTQLAGVGKKVILVMIEGRPRLIHDAVTASNAVVLAYEPGPVGGQAIAEVLFGKTVPSGRLPFSYPRYPADIMYPYHHKWSDQCTVSTGPHSASYIVCDMEWVFGTGLSYSTFQYSALQLSTTDLTEDNVLTVSVTVTNTGTYAAKHSVLLFLYDMYRRVTPEYKLLKRFTKISLAVGEARTVSFTLSSKDLEYIGVDGYYLLEGGSYYIGMTPYTDCRTGEFEIASQDTTSNGQSMCQPFNLTLPSDYNPVCNKACAMWSVGICGTKISSSQCMQTCNTEGWSWDYVNCILDYYDEASCTNPATMQCYDAFSFATPEVTTDSNDDDLQYSSSFVVLLTVFLCLFTLILGFALGYFYLKYQVVRNVSDLRKPLISVFESNHGQRKGETTV
eukprot:gene1562-1654_t